MTTNEFKAAIEAKINAANALVKQVIAGTAAADAEDQIEVLSDEAEALSDQIAAIKAEG